MESISIGYVAMVLLGLTFGSYAGATVWRLRARQLVDEEREQQELHTKQKSDKLTTDQEMYLSDLEVTQGERAEELERLRPLTNTSLKNDRSRCLGCHHELKWYDLLPLVSWLSTGGRCRYCRRAIGRFEPLMELGTAAAFVGFYAWWVGLYGPTGLLLLLVLWLAVIVMLVILFAYDQKWFILPDRVVFPLIGVSALIAAYTILTSDDVVVASLSTFGSVALLGGLYYVLWRVSAGKWVGFGDVKLGVALGLLLANWQLAFLALFLANLIGTLLVLPGLLMKKVTRETQVPFGPLLIVGFSLSLLFGTQFFLWFETVSVWLTSSTLML